MTTVRQIERFWNAKAYARLAGELVGDRTDAAWRAGVEVDRPIAAALGVSRLDELSQAHAPLAGELLRALLISQEPDGGWGDPLRTAVCLHALLAGDGNGEAIDRGLAYLAALQQPDGIWPRVAFRRMPADSAISAWILFHLAAFDRFRAAVRFDDAIAWFNAHLEECDAPTRKLWNRISTRLGLGRIDVPQRELIWS